MVVDSRGSGWNGGRVMWLGGGWGVGKGRMVGGGGRGGRGGERGGRGRERGGGGGRGGGVEGREEGEEEVLLSPSRMKYSATGLHVSVWILGSNTFHRCLLFDWLKLDLAFRLVTAPCVRMLVCVFHCSSATPRGLPSTSPLRPRLGGVRELTQSGVARVCWPYEIERDR